MYSRRLKTGCFILEGLNSFATTYYFYYFYFFAHQKFGFDNKANLMLAAIAGLVYVPAAIFGGRFAQRAGYFTALKLGFAIMIGALSVGWFVVDSAAGHITVMLVTTLGMCFTWPTLEGLVSEGEDYPGLQRNLGIYNVVWAGTGALAYFSGGAMLDKFGLNSMFYVPLAMFCGQLALTFWLAGAARHSGAGKTRNAIPADEEATVSHPRPPEKARAFLRMAWLANPFSYIAINTLVAVMPGVAQRLGLSTTLAGVCCSVWCFARLAAFFGLWFWPGWHYRFRWLLAAYLALIVTFAVILMLPNLVVMLVAEMVLGVALGLIYYSSLFYSMDVGDTKGEHGGIHEAAIGLGNFVGPAVGAASLHFLPQFANSGAMAVSVLLLGGLGGLLGIWRTTKT
jgi:predicted MFS family arabinose efflux permease